MKDYINYMDNISPDPALKGKIIMRARSKPSPTAGRRTYLSYAGLVATAAVLLFGMWLMPGTIRNLRGPEEYVIHISSHDNNENGSLYGIDTGIMAPAPGGAGDVMAGGVPYYDAPPQLQEAAPEEGIPIPWRDERWHLEQNQVPPYHLGRETHIFSRLYASGGARSSMMMTFSHELTAQQFQAVFPNIDPAFTATAIYCPEGVLLEVSASKFFNYSHSTHIMLDTCESTHEETKSRILWQPYSNIETSYMHGVLVTTLSADHTGIHVAVFMLDNIGYIVTHTVAPDDAQGYTQLSAVVNALILGGPADLSVLADPEIPELRNDHITLAEARQDPDFGHFVPANIPPGMNLGIANRWICQDSDFLLLSWDGSTHTHLRWMIRKAENHHHESQLTAQDLASQEHNQRLPVFEGETHRARRVFAIPVIAIEDLTLELLETFTHWLDSHTDDMPDRQVLSIAILYNDVVLEISASMLSPEQILDMLPRYGL
ncbi:MAG: hypothetical protein FWC77_05005 [Defluviitaleaceae bacterium]|nr:hypothetical protein [Defluviitaleaceae bacterium]